MKYSALILAAVTAAVTIFGCTAEDPPTLLGTLERDRLELVAESQEPVVEIAVTEGQRVVAGQVLLRLDPATFEQRLAQARAGVAQAERRLAELVTGPRREQILAARARLAGAEARLTAARREFERVADLVGRRLLPENDLDNSRAARDTAEADASAAREALLELERGTRSEVLDQAGAALDAARAQLAEVEVSTQRLTVRAPRDGLIEALPYELGERPPRGAPVVVMLADGQPYARVFVPEPVRASIAAGTEATIRISASERTWAGQVRYVASDAAFTPYYALNERDRSRLSYLAEVVLTQDEARDLPTGVPVEVTLGSGGRGR